MDCQRCTLNLVILLKNEFDALFFFFFQLPTDKILGLAKFFLGIGIPGDGKDFFNQVDSLAFLESNRLFVFLTVLSVYVLHFICKWHLTDSFAILVIGLLEEHNSIY